ncbi:MAG: DUF2288 domain-containing protein [bacterium]|nr:DUF2288 domain-containing protein [bacterium]
MQKQEQSLRSKLEAEIGPADWKVIRPHFLRGAIIIVAPELDLIDVAVKVAEDDTTAIKIWIEEGRLTKPFPEDAKIWEEEKKELSALVVDPFVLVQDSIK